MHFLSSIRTLGPTLTPLPLQTWFGGNWQEDKILYLGERITISRIGAEI